MALLQVQELSKIYPKSNVQALDHVSFDVDEGAIYAFIGSNGAGKTTTIRIISTLLRYDEGSVKVGGYEVRDHPRDVRRMLGYIPDEFGLYDDMTVREYLAFFATCFGLDTAAHPHLVTDALELVGLTNRTDSVVSSLSRGMRQRLGLARALVHDPLLIVADEPAAGLDPRARSELRDIFRALQEMGKTIFISSHVLREMDDVATHACIIDAGKIVASGPIETIKATARDRMRNREQSVQRVRIRFIKQASPSLADAHAWLAQYPGMQQVIPGTEQPDNGTHANAETTFFVALHGGEQQTAALLGDLVRAGFPVISFTEEQETLEDMFLQLTEDRKGVI